MGNKYLSRNRRRLYVREWIDHLETNQERIAEKMETDPANITRWIKEPWRITLDVISGLADALGIPAENLFVRPADAQAKTRVLSIVRDASRILPPSDDGQRKLDDGSS